MTGRGLRGWGMGGWWPPGAWTPPACKPQTRATWADQTGAIRSLSTLLPHSPMQHQGMTPPPAAYSCLQYPNNPYPARFDDCHPVQILMLMTPNDAMHEHFRSNQRTLGHHVLMWVTVCCIRSAKEAVP